MHTVFYWEDVREKRRLGRPRRRWENKIKMDLREVGCDSRDWIAFAEGTNKWRAYVVVGFYDTF